MNKFEEAAKKKAAEKREARIKARDEAQKFVDEFRKEHGNNGFISLRIRDGFIGKEVGNGRLQLERTKPRGTLVAIKGENGEVFIGSVYKSNKDDDVPIVGIAEALKDAIARKEGKKGRALKNKDLDLWNFFYIRSRCYFFPEIYSHTRGTSKLSYPNYDIIHKNRAKALTFIGREDLI
jgi:hypothetical protein